MLSTTRTLSQEDIKNKMDERYIIAQDRCLKTVIKRIKEAMRFYDPKESKYQFEVPSTKTPVYDPRMGHFCLPRIHGRSKRRSTQNPATAKKVMRIFSILKTILKNLRRKNLPTCKKRYFTKIQICSRGTPRRRLRTPRRRRRRRTIRSISYPL